MAQRYMPYGYMMQNGEIVQNPQEAEAVREIYDLYESGESYLSIATVMNGSTHPKYNEQKDWSKNHIKRILENNKYTGADDYPHIISGGQYDRCRALLQDKTNGGKRARRDEFQPIWDKAVCGECGGKMWRTGTRSKKNNDCRAHCSNPECGNRITVARATLADALLSLQRDYAAKLAEADTERYIT